jgi:hypothetical protein
MMLGIFIFPPILVAHTEKRKRTKKKCKTENGLLITDYRLPLSDHPII